MARHQVFIAHAFTRKQNDDLRDAIERAFDGTMFEPYYADTNIRSGKYILEKIEEIIKAAAFGIYDITTANPNVCLEFGLAKGAGKPFYVIFNKEDANIPADLRGLIGLEYETYRDLSNKIKEKILPEQIENIMRIEALMKFKGPLNVTEDKIIEDNTKLYQAEKMNHKYGQEVEDGEAHNGRAWLADLSTEAHHFLYGPYEPLDEMGTYVAIFKMKINNNSSDETVFILEVYGEARRSLAVHGTDFYKPLEYSFFGIPFEYEEHSVLEFRAINRRNVDVEIWTDYVSVVRVSWKDLSWIEIS